MRPKSKLIIAAGLAAAAAIYLVRKQTEFIVAGENQTFTIGGHNIEVIAVSPENANTFGVLLYVDRNYPHKMVTPLAVGQTMKDRLTRKPLLKFVGIKRGKAVFRLYRF